MLLLIPVKVLVGFGSWFGQHGCINQWILELVSFKVDCEATASKCLMQNESFRSDFALFFSSLFYWFL